MTSSPHHSNSTLWRTLCLLGMFACRSAAASPATHQHGAKSAKAMDLGTTVAVDPQGTLWTVQKELQDGGQFLVLKKSTDVGQTWSAPARITDPAEPVTAEGEGRPKLAFGNKGELYISYTKPYSKNYSGDVRFTRSLDGGRTFEPPRTVHVNRDPITHRYDSMVVDPQGRIFIAWIDKRDGEAKRALKQEYTGAAIYYTVSTDRGATFAGDFRVADHSCECCRIALAVAPDGKVTALWRHVFAPNVRDHAMAVLSPTGAVSPLERATFDDWRIDACPHHGPAMAFAANGTRHQAWFGVKGEEGGVYYASAAPGKATGQPVKLGNDQAAHPAVAVDGANVVLAWRQFDGKATAILAKVSHDSGATWDERELARTAQASDYPALLNTGKGIVLAWRTHAEGLRILPLTTEKTP